MDGEFVANKNLGNAKLAKNDEFYTLLSDIEKEMRRYQKQFKDKTIFCNCDDPHESNFFNYFAMNFNFLGLKKLIATCYMGSPIVSDLLSLFDEEGTGDKNTKSPYKIEIIEVKDYNKDGAINLLDVDWLIKNDKNTLTMLKSNGDFRSPECVELLKEADIVVTNPPFSLFREYVAQLVEYDKKFIIIGNKNAITYKEIFRLIKDNKLWLGYNSVKQFKVPDVEKVTGKNVDPDTGLASFGNVGWFTNMDVSIRHEKLTLYKRYIPKEYPKYDNYDAINVDKVADIPMDYDDIMGVPITFLDKHDPEQFEIWGMCENLNLYNLRTRTYTTAECQQAYFAKFNKKGTYDLNASGVIIKNGLFEKVYQRILIKRIGATQ